MLNKLGEVKNRFEKDIVGLSSLEEAEKLRIKYLGRKGELTEILRVLKELPLEQRKKIGSQANVLRQEMERFLSKISAELKDKNYLASDLDITKPGHKIKSGHLHVLTKVENEIKEIFQSLNFSVAEGPEIEDEYHNFDALNIPANHPAREMWDTFWIKKDPNHKPKAESRKLLLRTHTSPVQIRYMEKNNPPFQIIAPGKVFRYEATDASHEINFSQLEGLMVGKDICLANFKFVVEEFFKKFFRHQDVEFRFRPSYFPFVEPGVEVDIKLTQNSKLKTQNWLEVAGAGMVHRKVFEAAGYNPDEWQGFAFGFGINRLAMIKYKIPDIRLFYKGDLRFIRQF